MCDKSYDVTVSIPASSVWQIPSSAATGAPLLGLVQGTDDGQRVGRRIEADRLELQLSVTMTPAAGTLGQDSFRWGILLDTQANKVFPAVLDIFDSTSVDALLNTDNNERFEFLDEGTIELYSEAGGTTAYTAVVERLCVKVPLYGLRVAFGDNTGSVTAMRDNAIYFICGSKNGLTTVGGFSRVWYMDQ